MNPGKQFEVRMYNKLQKLIATGYFGFDDRLVRVRYQPKYFSRERETYITFDISLEISRPGSLEPFLLWIWECKWSNSRSIDINEVERFNDQIKQVGASRVKGTVVTNSNFTQTVVSYAKHNGLGLVRQLDDGQPITLLENQGLYSRVLSSLLLDPEFKFAGMTSSVLFVTSLKRYLESELNDR